MRSDRSHRLDRSERLRYQIDINIKVLILLETDTQTHRVTWMVLEIL